MLAFAYYLLKVIICSVVLFGYYWFFLRNKVFHAYNRFYLLSVIVLSLAFPVMKFNIFNAAADKTRVIKMLQVVKAGDEYMDEIIIGAPTKSHLSFVDYLPFLYAIISAVLLVMFVQMLVSIFLLLKKHEKIHVENVHFINTDAARGTPFSFFKYIFWNSQIDINSKSGNRIFKHEIAHVQEGHSWDKMFINTMLIVFWSNPVFWLIRKELSMIHEFIADNKAVEDGDTTAFAAMILQATYPQKNFYLINNFFYSPIKRRLMMLTKNQHPRMNYISRLLALPFLVIVFGAFTIKIAEKIDSGYSSNKLMNKIIVVLDAGHGGQDNGAINKNGITEKYLALQLVKKIKALNKDENIQIILSRENDVFSDPRQKAAFAKSQAPDLFISVHLNSSPKEKWNTVSGIEVVVPKEDIANVEKSKLLGTSIINSFKNNYELTVNTTIFQRQRGVYVLQANDFPSVLIEAGYLTNDKDAAYLLSEKGQEAFAKNVLDAINNYALRNVNALDISKSKIIYNDTIGYYAGKPVISYRVNPLSDKCTIFFSDKTTMVITLKKAKEAKLLPPPPPPPTIKTSGKKDFSTGHFIDLDPAGNYNGKAVLMVSRNREESVSIMFERNQHKTISIEEAQKAGLPIPPSPNTSSDKIFIQVENEPKFRGGKDAWRKFLQTNLNGSIAVKEGLKAGSYTFITKFIVHEDGSLSDFTSEKNINDTIAKHCIEVIKKSAKWKPAIQNGYVVAAYKKLPITFVVAEE